MPDKRILLKEGFLVDSQGIKPCHFATVLEKDWISESLVNLVLIDGYFEMIPTSKKKVFTNEADAIAAQGVRAKAHYDFCRGQIDHYQKELEKEPKCT